MAETKSPDEPALPAKRKPDLTSEDHESLPLKSPKLQAADETVQGNHSSENHILQPSEKNDSSLPEPGPENEKSVIEAEEEGEEEEEEEDGEYEDDDDDDDDEEEENGHAVVDRKGKGILIEEEEDSDDDDDSSDGGNESGSESDLSDDPLAEVDLDNILPSRTRRRTVQPGVYIAKDGGSNVDADDSDDSDA
ncbi:hypothetical protein COLO4_13341 [Corchorus olitorius]|uniref:Histone chaperone domain-containing protein n=1 Tax=Corchorus olitorius TaxID=93759 RepID=A0A1R3JX39_9ROSI|nr:hypothetical protein COLO4_13341 [Corchorus olitorius]